MPYCHKCGSETKEKDAFCPQCGATLTVTEPAASRPDEPYRNEKEEKPEKDEKQEKMEKGGHPEKYEKQPYGVLGPLFGGVIMILIGVMFYLTVTGAIGFRSIFPFVLIVIGVLVLVGVAAGAVMARKRNPKPEG